MPLTFSLSRIAFAPADPPGGGPGDGGAPGGPRVQRPLVPGIPSRRVDANGVVIQQTRHVRPNQQQSTRHTVAEEGELVVGQGITVKGGIRHCRRLVVHGTVQATVPARALEVGPDGLVEGRIEVGEATIAGRFDGDLIVDGTLTVAPGALVKGRVRYRSLRVESGGHVSAEIDHIDNAPLPAERPETAAAQSPSVAPAQQAASSDADQPGETVADTTDEQAASKPAGDPAPVSGPETPGVPPAFNGLTGLTGGNVEAAADRTAAEAETSGDAPADHVAADDGAADDADQDAERFYRTLARTSARA